ncbi:hypothetical protein ACFLTQ_00095 [Chloroflexota bacterium]
MAWYNGLAGSILKSAICIPCLLRVHRKTWGHSVYTDALKLAIEAKVKKFGLFHHNQNRTDTALDEIIGNCRHIIENNRANSQCFAVYEGMEIEL